MGEVNHFCEVKDCGNSAVQFGLEGGRRIPACREHLALLSDKRIQMFDIEGYSFISSYQDAELFAQRKVIVVKGRGNLTALQELCNLQFTKALESIENTKRSALQSVEERFEEMKVAVNHTCEELKQQLLKVGMDLDAFIFSKENSLSPGALQISSALSVPPTLLRFGIADVSDSISALLSDSWAVANADVHSALRYLDDSLKNEAIANALQEALGLAQKGVPEALLYADSLIGDDASFDEGKTKVIGEILRVEKSQMERNLKWLQRSWELRQHYYIDDEVTVKVGLKLARFLYRQSGEFSEAEKMLRNCFEIAQAESKFELSMALCSEICGIYLASALYEKLEEMAAWVLERADLPAECYWTTLLYLTESKRLQSKGPEASAVLAYWRKPQQESKFAALAESLAAGIDASANCRQREAEQSLLKAWRIGSSCFPTSPLTALCSARLAVVMEDSSRGEYYHKQAQSIYEVASPKSSQAAINTMNLGLLLQASGRHREAESCLYQAKSIFEVASPNSMDAAVNLMTLGLLHKDSKKWHEARLYFTQAQCIYEAAGPQSAEAAKNLLSLGTLCIDLEQWADAEECLQRAWSICEVVSPNSSQAGKTLMNWGNLLYNTGRWKEAESCYLRALRIFDDVAPQSVQAGRLNKHLGTLFEALSQPTPAIHYFQKAAAVFAEIGDVGSRSEVEESIVRLTRAVGKYSGYHYQDEEIENKLHSSCLHTNTQSTSGSATQNTCSHY